MYKHGMKDSGEIKKCVFCGTKEGRMKMNWERGRGGTSDQRSNREEQEVVNIEKNEREGRKDRWGNWERGSTDGAFCVSHSPSTMKHGGKTPSSPQLGVMPSTKPPEQQYLRQSPDVCVCVFYHPVLCGSAFRFAEHVFLTRGNRRGGSTLCSGPCEKQQSNAIEFTRAIAEQLSGVE